MKLSDQIQKIAEKIMIAKFWGKIDKLWGKIDSEKLKKELQYGLKKMFDIKGQGAIDTMNIIRNKTLNAVRAGIKWYGSVIEEYSNDIESGQYNEKQTVMLKKLLDEFIEDRKKLTNINDELDTKNLTTQKVEKAINAFIKMI